MSLSKSNISLLTAYNLGYRIIDQIGAIDPTGKNLKSYFKKGYPFFWYSSRELGQQAVAFHRLNAYQKFGDLIFQKGIEVRHLNGDKSNFSSSNLEIGTSKDNKADIPKQLRKIYAKSAHLKNRKLSMQDVEKIRLIYQSEKKYGFNKKFADIYGVSASTISNIVNNKYYN